MTTSSQSVGDYFRAKLNAKAHGGRQARPPLVAASASARDARDDDDDGRAGLGLAGGASRILPPDGLNEEPVRGGIGASSSMFATMFMPRQPTANARDENTTMGVVEEIVVSHDASDHDDNPKKSEKMRAKEERRRKKEERRRKRAEAGQVDSVAVDAVPVDEAPVATRSKKKHREPEVPDDRLEDSHPSGADGRETIATKRRKKDKKSSKHRRLEE